MAHDGDIEGATLQRSASIPLNGFRIAALRAVGVLLALGLLLGTGGAARAQTTDPAAALEDARRAAERAERAAAESRELLERMRREREGPGVEEAEAAPQPAVEPAAPVAPAPAALPPPSPERAEIEAAIERAERAARQADDAARAARTVAIEARNAVDEYRKRYARTGFLVGVAAAYVLEDFDTGLDVDNSRSASATIGYRVHRYVSIELRGEYLDDFDVRASDADDGAFDADLDGYFFVVGPKFYPLAGSIQPFIGFGLGAMRAEIDGIGRDGTAINDAATEAVVRFAGGVDVFVSENLVLNLEAAYASPGGDLEGIDLGTLGAGLTFRF